MFFSDSLAFEKVFGMCMYSATVVEQKRRMVLLGTFDMEKLCRASHSISRCSERFQFFKTSFSGLQL